MREAAQGLGQEETAYQAPLRTGKGCKRIVINTAICDKFETMRRNEIEDLRTKRAQVNQSTLEFYRIRLNEAGKQGWS